MKLLLSMIFFLYLINCASTLHVYGLDEHKNIKEEKGIPFAVSILVEVTEETTYEIDPKIPSSRPDYKTIQALCKPTQLIKHEMFPLGDTKYINFEPSWISKSEFSVSFADNGSLKGVTLNSDPTASIETATNLLKSFIPTNTTVSSGESSSPTTAATVNLEEQRKKVCIIKSLKKTIKRI